MAIFAERYISELDEGIVLTPERYNPLRSQSIDFKLSTPLKDIAFICNEQVRSKDGKRYHVLNTSDARDGYLRIPCLSETISSNKKTVHYGDVLISRLRPYLKQIAFCDSDEKDLVASTEFYVLRSKDGKDIAFLVPFLFSDDVQQVFANAVEGSQHPRFKSEVLLDLRIPNSIIETRDELSSRVKEALTQYRSFESYFLNCVATANEFMNN